jgi:hypothetical protein
MGKKEGIWVDSGMLVRRMNTDSWIVLLSAQHKKDS